MERRSFLVRCRRTFVLNNTVSENDIGEPIMLNKFGAIAIFNFSFEVLENYCSKFSSLPSLCKSILCFFTLMLSLYFNVNIAIAIDIALFQS